MGLDMYELIKEGKSSEEIAEIVTNEYNAAEKRVEEERIAAEAEQKKQEAITEKHDIAVAALKEYLALVNPGLEENVAQELVDLATHLKYVKVRGSDVRGKSRMSLLDALWKW